jgi:hypothetical protein
MYGSNGTDNKLGDEGVALVAPHLPPNLITLNLQGELGSSRCSRPVVWIPYSWVMDVVFDFSENKITSLGIKTIAQSFQNLIYLAYFSLVF